MLHCEGSKLHCETSMSHCETPMSNCGHQRLKCKQTSNAKVEYRMRKLNFGGDITPYCRSQPDLYFSTVDGALAPNCRSMRHGIMSLNEELVKEAASSQIPELRTSERKEKILRKSNNYCANDQKYRYRHKPRRDQINSKHDKTGSKMCQFRIKMCQIRLKICQFRLKACQFRPKIRQIRLEIKHYP